MKLPLWTCSTHVSVWSQTKAESLDCGRVFAACIEEGVRAVCWCEADVLATVISRSRMSECQPSLVEYQTAWNFRIKIIYFLCWDKPTGEGSCMCSVQVPLFKWVELWPWEGKLLTIALRPLPSIQSPSLLSPSPPLLPFSLQSPIPSFLLR